MFPLHSRVRLVFDSYGLPEGIEGEIVGVYKREAEAMYVVRFPTEEQVLPGEDLDLLDSTLEPERPTVVGSPLTRS